MIGKHVNPPKFYPSANDSNARSQYIRTASYPNATHTGYNQSPPIRTSMFVAGTQKTYATLGNTKYKAPSDSSLYLSTLKSRAIGKSSITKDVGALSYKNYNTNDARHALKSVRGGGCVAPAKKGSIYNKSFM